MNRRRSDLLNLGDALKDAKINRPFIDAYLQDTGFLKKEIYRREVLTPIKLLENILEVDYLNGIHTDTKSVEPLGKVAIVLPKNSLGIPLAKAVAASYLMGNETIVRLPRQLTQSEPIYRNILTDSLKGIEFAKAQQSAQDFMRDCLKDPEVNAIVIYGDDAWIDEYYPLAKETQTKFIFEGPGNDPLIVLPDADLDAAVEGAIQCGLNNGGQSCSALERFFIYSSVMEEFTHRLVTRLKTLTLGRPDDPEVDIGPIASAKLVSRIQRQIGDAIAQGATLLQGGVTHRSTFKGLPILEPTVLSDCTPQMSVVRDETFGPVFPLIGFEGLIHLLPMLDNTQYGLNASVYGSCPELLSHYLETTHRNVFYNSTAVSPENRSQLGVDGGYKQSGFVWEQILQVYVRREGRRYLTEELSRPVLEPLAICEPCLVPLS